MFGISENALGHYFVVVFSVTVILAYLFAFIRIYGWKGIYSAGVFFLFVWVVLFPTQPDNLYFHPWAALIQLVIALAMIIISGLALERQPTE